MASNSNSTSSQINVIKLYNAVVDDVIAGVRDCFLDDGVDEQVLQELKQLWKSKLQATGVMDPPAPEPTMPPPPVLHNFHKSNGSNLMNKRNDTHMPQQSSSNSGVEHGAPPNIPGAHPHHILNPNNKVPVQLTLPAQPGVAGSQPRTFTIQIPASALNGNKLHQVLTGPIINATISLPQPLAATLLQQHINSALAEQDRDFEERGGGGRSGTAPFLSLDGALDSSDDEGSNGGDGSEDGAGDEDEDDDSPDERAEEEEEETADSGGAEDEPLNSGDDVSDEEPGDMFDTDNVVVCQYDKITRSRNKWKFHLKDGIMNLAGKDYIFQKANGDAEW